MLVPLVKPVTCIPGGGLSDWVVGAGAEPGGPVTGDPVIKEPMTGLKTGAAIVKRGFAMCGNVGGLLRREQAM